MAEDVPVTQLRSRAEPAEGVWSLLKRSIANFVTADLTGLVRLIKRKLKKIQYRPELIAGCLAETGLIMDLPKVDTAATTSSTSGIQASGVI